ncbi:hypothetical protein EXU57_24280 [Segetibacter sp. 3557_3]|uniref:hypothetical protein n=1 Tax=Segetibacter sp. 3557_3 TaxID=2547429 RepID=UPI0010591445|nr:hypothetical protein [Segetibacter sp. 3557_3]TDH18171.1 hypothetical protein EXU57_24280 [Segetibacter sp. 3557_3]
MAKQNDKMIQELSDMYLESTPFLMEYPWEKEGDRWALLVTCMFSGLGITPEQSSQTVEILQDLGVLTPKALTNMNDERVSFVEQVLLVQNIEPDVASVAVRSLIKFAMLVCNKWEGYIQRFVRQSGVGMVKELKTSLESCGIDNAPAHRIAVIWLQSVCNIPIMLPDDPNIKAFCSKHKVTESQLIDILDDIGFNAGLADDLLALNGDDLRASQQKNGKVASGDKNKLGVKKRGAV